MLGFLVRKMIKNHDDVHDASVRERYGMISGVMGIAGNALLFGGKLAIGLLMQSIAIISDAFNNLSDAGSSLVTIIATKLSNRRPDREHPFGHGRYEYIAAFVVAVLILVMGIELGKNAIKQIAQPEPVAFSWVMVAILAASILVKVVMYAYNRAWGQKIDSPVLRAAAKDSLNDVVATAAVIAATIAGQWTAFPLDGVMGLLVSLLILYTGFDIAKETVGMLLGAPPTKETVEGIKRIVLRREQVMGIHDLIVHDYGPGRVMASLHAEVPDDLALQQIHEVIDDTEQCIRQELGIETVIHMDPVAMDCEETAAARVVVEEVIQEVSDALTIHDFRMVKGEERTNLIFDLVAPYTLAPTQCQEVCETIRQKLREADARYYAIIQVDQAYTE